MNEIKHLGSKNLPKESRVKSNFQVIKQEAPTPRHFSQNNLLEGYISHSIGKDGRYKHATETEERREEREGMVMAEKQMGPTPTEMDPWVCRRSRMVLFRIRFFSLPRPPIPFYYYFNNHQSAFVLKTRNQSHSLLERVRARSPGPSLSRATQTDRRVQLKVHPQRLYKEGCNHLKPKRTRQLQLGWVRICQPDPIRFPT